MSRYFTVEQVDKARVSRRRATFFSLVFLFTSLASWFMADLLSRGHVTGVEVTVLVLFTILFAHIAVGFSTALLGLYVINRGGDSARISRSIEGEDIANLPLASTAVIMPVFNEDTSRVFEGLRVIYRSLEHTGRLEDFDFFVLSDSNDANRWIQEEVAWVELCKQLGAFGRIFYRKRRIAINKKSGNVGDFLRRWGRNYRYMVVLDADSIMTGEAIVKLVALMERNPRVGILQTAPRIVNGTTLYARMQQFANRLYSPLFLAGLNYWAQGEGNYWGHNAVIRVAPFLAHCGLPDLPGVEPFGGRILSHDFVEAALMRKAGWTVWLAHDLEGSFEEGPPTLIDSAKRDRRWCQGNMQHSWLLFARGFHPINRFHLLLGVMAYVASPLWLLFMLISTMHRFHEVVSGVYTLYRAENYTLLFNRYIVEVPEALALFGFTMLLLFLPKIVSVVLELKHRRGQAYGGPVRLVASALAEMALSALLAPVNMMFHAKFVLYILLGQGVSWITQKRTASDDADWREAILTHSAQAGFGLVWGLSAFILLPSFFWWLLPVLLGLVLSVPLSLLLGKASFGRRAQAAGLFLTPDETEPAPVLPLLDRHLAECYRHMQPIEELRDDYGLLQAVLDPYINAVHVSLLRQRQGSFQVRRYFVELRRRLLTEGPARLTPREKMALLRDAESMNWLHEQLWKLPAEQLAGWWRLAMRQYNVLTATPVTALYR